MTNFYQLTGIIVVGLLWVYIVYSFKTLTKQLNSPHHHTLTKLAQRARRPLNESQSVLFGGTFNL
jgi:hypothetical protein